MIQFVEDAAKRIKELIIEKKDRNDIGIRILAEKCDDQIHSKIFWENEKELDDVIILKEELKIYLDPISNELLKDSIVFLTEQEGKEGLFIMNNNSNCARCSTICF